MTVLLSPATLNETIRQALEAGRRRAERGGLPALVCVTVPAPAVDPVRLYEAAAGESFLWERRSEARSLVGIGAAVRIEARGPGRFSQAEARWRELQAQALAETPAGCPVSPPVGVGGFAFDADGPRDPDWNGFPRALLLVPRLLFVFDGGSGWLTVSAAATSDRDVAEVADAISAELERLHEGARERVEVADGRVAYEDEDGPEAWRCAVGAVVAEIRSGAVEKAVLARRLRARSERPVDPAAVLRQLRARGEAGTVFAVGVPGASFLGATPERLVRLEGRELKADCLAGSAPRGATVDEDRRLGETLLADGKERHEHALVVEALREALAPVCSVLHAPEKPGLLRMPNVQHLHTPVGGTLQGDTGILGLVDRLHPTPAVGGLPRDAALRLIRRYERFERGWYAGPVGWLDARGGGDFVAGIRSALVRGREALLYAGCGIVAGSDPEREYEESRLKLEPMRWALDGGWP